MESFFYPTHYVFISEMKCEGTIAKRKMDSSLKKPSGSAKRKKRKEREEKEAATIKKKMSRRGSDGGCRAN